MLFREPAIPAVWLFHLKITWRDKIEPDLRQCGGKVTLNPKGVKTAGLHGAQPFLGKVGEMVWIIIAKRNFFFNKNFFTGQFFFARQHNNVLNKFLIQQNFVIVTYKDKKIVK